MNIDWFWHLYHAFLSYVTQPWYRCQNDKCLTGKTLQHIQEYQAKITINKAAICFNKICRANRLMPKYFNIKINSNNQQTKKTRLAAIKYWINQEIKFLYCKKQTVNDKLYHIHLECITYLNTMWQYIQTTVDTQLDKMMDNVYHRLSSHVPLPLLLYLLQGKMRFFL